MYSAYGKYPSQNDIMHTFHYFDKNRSGSLERQEFKRMLKYLAGIPSKSGKY